MNKDLSRLFRPRHIALLGGGWAANAIRACQAMGYEGQIWPVHPSKPDIAGIPTYSSLSALPEAPDAAFVAVNRDLSIEVMRELSALGAGGAVSFASGFAETDDADKQAALVAAAGDMPMLGPNCYGVINYLDGALLWPDQHGGERVESGVAIVSQSSNIAINMTMAARGLPIAYMACVGNPGPNRTGGNWRSFGQRRPCHRHRLLHRRRRRPRRILRDGEDRRQTHRRSESRAVRGGATGDNLSHRVFGRF